MGRMRGWEGGREGGREQMGTGGTGRGIYALRDLDPVQRLVDLERWEGMWGAVRSPPA